MCKMNKQKNRQKYHFEYFITQTKLVSSIIILFLAITSAFAQEIDKPKHFGVQGGIITGILGGGFGPSLSFHYALRPDKVLQPEIALSFESQKGETFLSGYSSSSSALSLTAGARINIRPQANWNPSLLILGGIMSGKDKSNRYDDPGSSGISGAINIGVSNTFNKKNMITLGILNGEYIDGFYLKYGYWF